MLPANEKGHQIGPRKGSLIVEAAVTALGDLRAASAPQGDWPMAEMADLP